jgi:hypothetical protein
MADDLANVSTARVPLTGEPLEDHDRFLGRRRDRGKGSSHADPAQEDDEAVEQDTENTDEEPHQLDVNA